MSEKKVRAIIFLVVAIIAFLCSSVVFSATGGVTDWFGEVNDTNASDEGFGVFNEDSVDSYSTSDDNSQNDDNSGFLDDLTKKDKNSSSNSTKPKSNDSSVSSYSTKDKYSSVSRYSG